MKRFFCLIADSRATCTTYTSLRLKHAHTMQLANKRPWLNTLSRMKRVEHLPNRKFNIEPSICSRTHQTNRSGKQYATHFCGSLVMHTDSLKKKKIIRAVSPSRRSESNTKVFDCMLEYLNTLIWIKLWLPNRVSIVSEHWLAKCFKVIYFVVEYSESQQKKLHFVLYWFVFVCLSDRTLLLCT